MTNWRILSVIESVHFSFPIQNHMTWFKQSRREIRMVNWAYWILSGILKDIESKWRTSLKTNKNKVENLVHWIPSSEFFIPMKPLGTEGLWALSADSTWLKFCPGNLQSSHFWFLSFSLHPSTQRYEFGCHKSLIVGFFFLI